MNILISDQADADLLQIISYLVERNPAAAHSVVREIDKKFENLSHFFPLSVGSVPVSRTDCEASLPRILCHLLPGRE
jgi:plasmid stabilization system protein ParE